MRYKDISEMPVGNITATDVGPKKDHEKKLDKDDGSSFPDRRDWAQVSRGGLVGRAIHALRRSPVQMDWYFYRLPRDIYYDGDRGHVIDIIEDLMGLQSPGDLKYLFKEAKIKSLPAIKPGVVNVLFFQHQKADDLMTPWIMAHRISHAFEGETENIINKIADHLNIQSSHFLYGLKTTISSKAGRENRLLGNEELLNELLTQFLYTGKVTLNPQFTGKSRVDIGYNGGGQGMKAKKSFMQVPRASKLSPEQIEYTENELNKGFLAMVNGWVTSGKYIVAY